MAKPYNRLTQISDAIARHVTVYLQKELGETFGIIQCTHVDIDSDLRNGRVYISFYPPLNKEIYLGNILSPHKKAISDILKRQVPIKWIPKLSYYIDKSTAEADRINQLIDKI